ncbi:MAG: iron ABC transporter permease [Bacteroidales bacterium]|nr:iron ABC transporter permease [Bacteroidales bacterium]
MESKKNTVFWFLVFAALLVVLFLANLGYGSVLISWEEVWTALTNSSGTSETAQVIVQEYRLPQAVTALAVGMALGVAGLLLQTLFRNPLAGPSVLGISSGASLGVALVVLLGGVLHIPWPASLKFVNDLSMVLLAFAGSLVVLGAILFVSGRIGNIVSVLIIGIMIGYAVSAVVGMLQYFSRSTALHAYVIWGLGSFSNTSPRQAAFLFAAALLVVLFSLLFFRQLNALLLGDHYARSVGVNTRRTQLILLLVAGLLTALATAFTGPIAFVGLAVPHLARSFYRSSNHGVLLPAVILMGAVLTLFCNLIAKLPGYDTSLPINAVTSLIGAPIVVWVIVKRGRVKQE